MRERNPAGRSRVARFRGSCRSAAYCVTNTIIEVPIAGVWLISLPYESADRSRGGWKRWNRRRCHLGNCRPRHFLAGSAEAYGEGFRYLMSWGFIYLALAAYLSATEMGISLPLLTPHHQNTRSNLLFSSPNSFTYNRQAHYHEPGRK